MKIAIFGGSFNPVHNAHIKLAERFVSEVGLQKVIFVPTNKTPLKDNRAIVCPEHRFNMCTLAVEGIDCFEVSDVEINRDGLSYTSETIAYFKDTYPDDDLYLILGADMFCTLEQWHDYKYIFKNVTLLTAPRDDVTYDELCNKLETYNKYNCKAILSEQYIQDLSSTVIRDKLASGQDVTKLINNNVFDYINKHSLYR